jgi:c-di-GMP-binding flagellar brake protein YcgR
MSEKRLYRRMNIELPASFEMGGSRGRAKTTTMDISAKGLALRMKDLIKVGQRFRVSISTEDNKNVRVDADVVWVVEKEVAGGSEYTAGFKVVDKMDQDEIEFVRFVAQKMFDYFKPSE